MDTGVDRDRDRDWNVVLLRVTSIGDASDVSKSFIYQLMHSIVALKEY